MIGVTQFVAPHMYIKDLSLKFREFMVTATADASSVLYDPTPSYWHSKRNETIFCDALSMNGRIDSLLFVKEVPPHKSVLEFIDHLISYDKNDSVQFEVRPHIHTRRDLEERFNTEMYPVIYIGTVKESGCLPMMFYTDKQEFEDKAVCNDDTAPEDYFLTNMVPMPTSNRSGIIRSELFNNILYSVENGRAYVRNQSLYDSADCC